jgi:hypothetical protein
MDAKGKKRIIIWVSVAALLGVGGYFAYTKLIKPKLDEKKAKKAAEEAAKLAASSGSTPTSGSGSAPSNTSSGSSSAPLTQAQTRAFQDWMDINHPNWVRATNSALNNGTNLGSIPSKGYGTFGTSTTAAYNKYGAEWRASLNVTAPRPAQAHVPASGYSAIGRNAFPKTGNTYANVWSRPDASVSNWFGSYFIGQINQPNIIGRIVNTTIGADGQIWYNVTLLTPLSNSTAVNNLGNAVPNQTSGWVRGDQITIK